MYGCVPICFSFFLSLFTYETSVSLHIWQRDRGFTALPQPVLLKCSGGQGRTTKLTEKLCASTPPEQHRQADAQEQILLFLLLAEFGTEFFYKAHC